jgi:hypothetical protein
MPSISANDQQRTPEHHNVLLDSSEFYTILAGIIPFLSLFVAFFGTLQLLDIISPMLPLPTPADWRPWQTAHGLLTYWSTGVVVSICIWCGHNALAGAVYKWRGVRVRPALVYAGLAVVGYVVGYFLFPFIWIAYAVLCGVLVAAFERHQSDSTTNWITPIQYGCIAASTGFWSCFFGTLVVVLNSHWE